MVIDALLDHVLPRVLGHLTARPVLHASSVVTESGLILFLGASGAGKSTLAASFALRRNHVASDDTVMIGGGLGRTPFGVPGYFGFRLRPDSRHRLDPRGASFDSSTGADGKHRFIPATSPSHHGKRFPIAAMFLLRRGPGEPTVHPRRGGAAVVELIEHSFTLDLFDREIHARRLQVLADLAESTPSYELHYPRDFDGLDVLQSFVLETVRGQSARSPVSA